VRVVEIAEIAVSKDEICRTILEALPEWFGIQEAREAYAREAADLPMIVCRVDGAIVGFLSLKIHTSCAAEAYVLGIRPEFHRRGLGRRLFQGAERMLHERRICLLTVKTLAPSHPDPGYAATRRFYEAIGFLPVEVFPTLWGPANPCLFMIKPLFCVVPTPVGDAAPPS